jgi:hypothetical protein
MFCTGKAYGLLSFLALISAPFLGLYSSGMDLSRSAYPETDMKLRMVTKHGIQSAQPYHPLMRLMGTAAVLAQTEVTEIQARSIAMTKARVEPENQWV